MPGRLHSSGAPSTPRLRHCDCGLRTADCGTVCERHDGAGGVNATGPPWGRANVAATRQGASGEQGEQGEKEGDSHHDDHEHRSRFHGGRVALCIWGRKGGVGAGGGKGRGAAWREPFQPAQLSAVRSAQARRVVSRTDGGRGGNAPLPPHHLIGCEARTAFWTEVGMIQAHPPGPAVIGTEESAEHVNLPCCGSYNLDSGGPGLTGLRTACQRPPQKSHTRTGRHSPRLWTPERSYARWLTVRSYHREPEAVGEPRASKSREWGVPNCTKCGCLHRSGSWR